MPIMYERLHTTFRNLNVDIKSSSLMIAVLIMRKRPFVLFLRMIPTSWASNIHETGSQMAFMSEMTEVNTDAVVLLDGDLQDPPELIEKFLKRIEGYDVVYGDRI